MGIASPTQGSSRPASTTLSTGDVFNVSDFRDKEEVIEYLTRKLDNLENIATDLARAIIEVRTVVDQLR
jgi:mannitol/fructose-specific phosphotransferase system IIA component (Ntr-type)